MGQVKCMLHASPLSPDIMIVPRDTGLLHMQKVKFREILGESLEYGIFTCFPVLVTQPRVDKLCYYLYCLFYCYLYFGLLRLLCDYPILSHYSKTWGCEDRHLEGIGSRPSHQTRMARKAAAWSGEAASQLLSSSTRTPGPLPSIFLDARKSSILSYLILIEIISLLLPLRYRTSLTDDPFTTSHVWPVFGQIESKQEDEHDLWRWGMLCEGDSIGGKRWALSILLVSECMGFAYLRRMQTLAKTRCYFEFFSQTTISYSAMLKKNEVMMFIILISKCS